MKKTHSESQTKRQVIQVDRNIYTLRISNFNPQIQSSPFISNRYVLQDKIIKRRQGGKTPYNLRREVLNPQNERRAFSSQQSRGQSKNRGDEEKQKKMKNIEVQINYFKDLLAKKSKLNNNKDTQNIHFTEYVLSAVHPPSPSLLHPRIKRECSFMKSVKARNLMNRSAEPRSKSREQDQFKSIELNNTSKYVSSKRIFLRGASNPNVSKQLKNYKPWNKAHVHRQSHLLKHKKASKIQPQPQCRPWQTSVRFDHYDDDHNMSNL